MLQRIQAVVRYGIHAMRRVVFTLRDLLYGKADLLRTRVSMESDM
jgi:hypothetical protein